MTTCHVCGFSNVEPLVQKGRPFRLVSSDVQPVMGTAEFSLCTNCLTVQKTITPAWQAMAERIYANYDINHQSQGAEPTIFDSTKGSGPRSMILLRNFLETVALPEQGRLLDIGCSNGNLLKSFHSLRPGWKLSGAELVDQWRETVLLMLPGVEAFYSGPNPAYEGKFDVISLSHVLEHIPDPVTFLKAIVGHLTPRGRILLASPNLLQNPSDLIIADHCTHFDEDSFTYVAGKAGLGIEFLSAKMLPKELIALLSDGRGMPSAEGAAVTPRQASFKERCLFFFDLLDDVRGAAAACRAEKRPFGVMGSSIAACWTLMELEGNVEFFVDEDENRIGRELLGRPIIGPVQVPAGAIVFIPMSVAVAEKIMTRWKDRLIDFRYVATNRPI